jgi:Zn-dependent protease
MLFENPILFFSIIPILIFSFVIHEYSHAYSAYKLGDGSQKYKGRMSLDPRRHIDPIGFLMLMAVGFGWAKPVEINPYAFKKPERDNKIVAFAGPLSNFVMAFILTGIYVYLESNGNLSIFSMTVLYYGIMINLFLMTFNLIPLPPLDGSKIFLPRRILYKLEMNYEQFRIIFLILIFSGTLGRFIIIPVSGFVLDTFTTFFRMVM